MLREGKKIAGSAEHHDGQPLCDCFKVWCKRAVVHQVHVSLLLRVCSCAAASATPADADQGGWDGSGESWENVERSPWPSIGALFITLLYEAHHITVNASCFYYFLLADQLADRLQSTQGYSSLRGA